MGALTEPEIFDCLVENFRKAAEECDTLALMSAKGPAYKRLRENLKLIEGALRQGAWWREDCRFLDLVPQIAKCHKLAGEWLRGVKMPDGTRRKLAPGHLNPAFVALAAKMRQLAAATDRLRHMRTGRVGMILPPSAIKTNRPKGEVFVQRGALLVPASAMH